MINRSREKLLRFEDLDVWKRAARLSADIYIKLRDLRDFTFKEQITRSGLSIPSNIAEGHERESNKEALTFCHTRRHPAVNCERKFISE